MTKLKLSRLHWEHATQLWLDLSNRKLSTCESRQRAEPVWRQGVTVGIKP